MLYAAPECDLEQCQWGPRPVLGGGPQDDHNSLVRGKVILQPQGKEFFTCRGKNFFTSGGKEFFT